MGHKVLSLESPDNSFINVEIDLFIKNIEFESLVGLTVDEITSNIFNYDLPLIPVISLTESSVESSDYPTLKHVLKTAPYRYILKHEAKPYDVNEIKFTINMALYKLKNENKNGNGNLKDNSLSNKTQEALRESEDKFSTFIQQSLDGIVLLDEQGHVIEWNKGNELITGIKKEDVIGKKYWKIKYELTPPERRTPQRLERVKKLQLEALKTGKAPFLSKIHDTKLIRPDGKLKYVEQLAFPIKTNKGYRIGYVTRDVTQRKQMEEALEKRIVALSRPLDSKEEIRFHDLFNLEEIQEIQDLFAEATGVASLITQPDGTPITRPSNFRRLCIDIVRNTETGRTNCFKSDSIIGRHHPEGPIIQTCLSGGLWDAGASITVGDKHIANWLIGQVRNEAQDEDKMRSYARKIGVNEEEYIKAFLEVPIMSKHQLKRITQVLFAFANQLSSMAYQNIQQARFITEREDAEKNLEKSLHEKEIINQVVIQLVKGTNTKEIYSIIGRSVKELLPDSYVLISAVDPDGKNIRIIEYFGLEKYLEKLENILKMGLCKMKFPLDEMNKEDIKINRTDVLTKAKDGIYNLASEKIPLPICKALERLLNIGKVYTVGFSGHGENFGALTIVLRKGRNLEHKTTIETIVYQASIALQRSIVEDTIKESLEEKSVLLREIHHRVKNNMQIISSLLNLQSQHVDELETRNVLKESQGRVRSMAMIHENLYQSPSLTHINFKDYIEKLTSHLFYTYGVQNYEIEQVLEVKDVKMNIETAIPCGLIINELVTNSLKYAFPPSKGNSKGMIKIELDQIKDQLKLVVLDNGVGLPSHIQPDNTETLGLQLVNNLVGQIEGTLKIDRTSGTKFTILFKELTYKERI